MNSQGLPHHRVYVRLGISRIHGIGVFAITTIEEGNNLFGNDHAELIWVEKERLEREELRDVERRLYSDFCIDAGHTIGCPVNFHSLTPGWYLNQPMPGEEANIRVDKDLNFFSARTIAEGEELTISYAELNRAGAEYHSLQARPPSAAPDSR